MALHDAAWNRNKPVMKLLIAQGADVNATDRDGITALHGAPLEGHEPVVKLLIVQGDDVNPKQEQQHSTTSSCVRWPP